MGREIKAGVKMMRSIGVVVKKQDRTKGGLVWEYYVVRMRSARDGKEGGG